jgi:hypothetical protein
MEKKLFPLLRFDDIFCLNFATFSHILIPVLFNFYFSSFPFSPLCFPPKGPRPIPVPITGVDIPVYELNKVADSIALLAFTSLLKFMLLGLELQEC